jgi:hypothetical protein
LLYGILKIALAKSKSENDFFVAKQYDNKNYFCVTNTTYALSWTTTEVDEKLEQGIVQRDRTLRTIILLYQYSATVY